MITELRIERFKCFRDQVFRCGPLTVLAGSNGVGKSTVLQSLLLVQLSNRMPYGDVPLNGHLGLQLGEMMDVLHHGSALADGIRFTLKDEESFFTLDLGGQERSRVLRKRNFAGDFEQPRKIPIPINGDNAIDGFRLTITDPKKLPHKEKQGFSYLSADRLGPQDRYEAVDFAEAGINGGARGEAVGQALVDTERKLVREALVRTLPSGDPAPKNVPRQTELWLSHIVRPILIDAKAIPDAGIVMLRFKEPGFGNEWMRPTNTGFGLSNALPIIVAGLSMDEGGVLLVENPESHLHPAAQSRMGAFLAKVAGSGVQVILETHSDHILNGIRRAAILEKVLDCQDVVIHFFQDAVEADDMTVGVTTIDLQTNGDLSQWPDGFFDQIETDLAALAKLRRGK